MNEEEPIADQPTAAPNQDLPVDTPQPVEPQPKDPARRLRELLAVPERDRSDPVWDEIVALEIQLAPGNRISPHGDGGRRQESGQHQEPRQRQDAGRRQRSGRRPDQGPGQGQGQARGPDTRPPGAKPGKRFFKKSRRGGGGP